MKDCSPQSDKRCKSLQKRGRRKSSWRNDRNLAQYGIHKFIGIFNIEFMLMRIYMMVTREILKKGNWTRKRVGSIYLRRLTELFNII